MAKRPTKTIADSARVPPVPTQADIDEDSKDKAALAREAKRADAEIERIKAGRIGRLLGWGEQGRDNAVFIMAAVVVAVLAVALFAVPDIEIKRRIIDVFQILIGGLAGYWIGGRKRRR